MDRQPIISAKDVEITFSLRGRKLNAIRKCSLDLYEGETLAIVGESGSGKSTTGRAIAGLQRISAGSLNVLGMEMRDFKERKFKPLREQIGFVFQDPGSSFDPLMTILENVAEPLIVHGRYKTVSQAKQYGGGAARDGAAAACIYEPLPARALRR